MADEPKTTVGALTSLSEKLVAALPPAFLLLVIINIIFLGITAWAFNHNTDTRSAMISKIVDACLLERSKNP